VHGRWFLFDACQLARAAQVVMRPPGDVRLALERAWQQGPAPVRVAADLACVGHAAARYTASRMVDSGHLVVVQPGKPAVLALAGSAGACDV
ncbi:hypothetical protein, partial [Streptococcus pseudopneumoniae]|uniref:hypothetical protein n=1 Tax=Streptococcus pseudopneumoniae TaxID=257758 RepID=UPI0019D5509F